MGVDVDEVRRKSKKEIPAADEKRETNANLKSDGLANESLDTSFF